MNGFNGMQEVVKAAVRMGILRYVLGFRCNCTDYLKYGGPEPLNETEAWGITLAKWLILSVFPFRRNGNSHTCGLCMFYYEKYELVSCAKCPVFLDTGKQECRGTPYYDYAGDEESRKEAAKKEFEYLVGLYRREVT